MSRERFSHERGHPLTFQLGIGHVILGWDKGLLGVCVGEKRKLVVPPQYGYGDVSGLPSQIWLCRRAETNQLLKLFLYHPGQA